MIEIGREPVQDALADGLEDLIAFNWDSTLAPDLPPLDIDWPKILMFERAGAFVGIAARKDEKLIGYASYLVQSHMRHKSTRWALNDALYVDAAHRRSGVGLKLMRSAEVLLKDDGVAFVTQGFMNLADKRQRDRFARLMRREGYRPYDDVFLKRL